jgi:hypothetical protein
MHDRGTLVTGDSGSPRDQLSTIYEALYRTASWVGHISTSASLAAQWVKLAYPERTCVAVAGDAPWAGMGNLEAPCATVGVTVIQHNKWV